MRISFPQSAQCGTVPTLPIQGATDANCETFEFDVEVYLKDVSPYQNVYFSRYFDWQGMCRERFLAEKILAGFQFDGIFLTRCAHQEYIDETFVFQRVKVQLNTFQVKRASSFLVFRFRVDDRLVSAGYQQLVCTGRDKQIERFPDFVFERARQFEMQYSPASERIVGDRMKMGPDM